VTPYGRSPASPDGELTERFLQIHGDEWEIECEVRPLDAEAFGA